MALCGGASRCGCAFFSDSLVMSGSGDHTNPLVIETYEGIVADDSEIASPFLGQRIYETTTGRLKVYDGTNWVVYGGNWPGWQVERQTAQTFTTNVADTVDFLTEIYDTDAFHAASSDTVTIPAGLGGDYLVVGNGSWAANATSYRYLRLIVGSNTGPPTQNGVSRVGGYTMVNTANNGFSVTEMYQLEPGATVQLQAFQLSGGDLDLTTASLKGIMLRHDPSLT